MIEGRKTLIILTPGFPANEEDTTCLPAQQSFVRSLNKLFPEVQIIILSFEYPFFKSEYLWYNNKTIAFGGRNKKHIFRFLLWRKVWKKLKIINQQENIIGLLSFWCTETALIGKFFARKNKRKHFCWLLGQDARKGNKHVRRVNPTGEELIALSDFIANEFYKNYRIFPLHVIPIGIDPSQFPTKAHQRDIDILGVGSLIGLKQYDIFIKIILQLKRIFPNIRAAICGKGGEQTTLKSLIISSKLEENVSLLGEKPHHEVLALMQRSKIFLHPSAYEGFGVVCLEALFAGAQVISFCNPANQKIDHWHIVKTEVEMIGKSVELLNSSSTDFTSVLPFPMDNTTKEIMKLFVTGP
jgi:glycosyltransferase involved in cell wall biosynthesis